MSHLRRTFIGILLTLLFIATVSSCASPDEQGGEHHSPLALPNSEREVTVSVLPTPTAAVTDLPPSSADTASTVFPPADTQPPAVTGQEKLILKAKEDLATRLGVDFDSISLVAVYADEFPIDNLGCPSPKDSGVSRPAFVMGQEIVLEVGEKRYAYHTHAGQVVFCGPRG